MPKQATMLILALAFVVGTAMPTDVINTSPCSPSPCGLNSLCREINDQAVCTCLIPSDCYPLCREDSDCGNGQYCKNSKCLKHVRFIPRA